VKPASLKPQGEAPERDLDSGRRTADKAGSSSNAFVIVVPFLVVALIAGLLAGVLSTPYRLFHHFRG
jgi:hypothetical protein